MWQKFLCRQKPNKGELVSESTPSLRRRFIIGGISIISVIAALAINFVFEYSQRLADISYDRLLRSALLQMDENIGLVHNKVTIDIPWSAFATLAQANDDRVFYKVVSSSQGFITGYRDLNITPPKPPQLDKIQFFDREYSGEMVRFAWLERHLTESESTGTVRIIIGQTRLSREELSSSVTERAVEVVLMIALVAVALIVIGSQLVLRPLHRISRVLEERQPGDLTPINIKTPKETHHLKMVINHFMARLQTNLEQLENYTADAAHQLRTPLASLRALAENARDKTSPERQQEALENIVTQCDSLSQTVTLLLNQAVVSHRMQTNPKEPVDLLIPVTASCREQAITALHKGVSLSLEANVKRAMVFGDAFALQQMMQNLIENAVRYSSLGADQATEVVVRVEEFSNYYRINVIDYGAGIPKEEKKRVFERFYRGRYDTAGSGVGLAMVKDIIDHHTANIIILDTQPNGTTFQIDIAKYQTAHGAEDFML
ncbi:Swarming motility regulation sensor protein RssA [Marinomonas spartinae]|uniref:histidine kinase n=1 Tax=Marinomonas spartinae TaxID=1792290 RepID=A0A1A8TC17_9GAMM|nr:sensor histidine kinase [Marinomonas spartinae]SBS30248.1 Swarming motility regulation sensor protein RssA [Marinomonas spartinae]